MAQALSDPSHNGPLIDLGADSTLFTRRLRHITSIQVRNLTPFPVRDAFTSALLQQAESLHSVSTANDDLGVTSSRWRSRKISSNSVATRSSLKWDDGLLLDEDNMSPPPTSSGAGTIRRRKTSSGSRVNFATVGDENGVGTSPRSSTFNNRVQRPRTTSKASSTSSRAHASVLTGSSAMRSSSSFLPDHSQKGLEKVIDSRLLETCLVLSVLEFPPEVAVDHSLSQRTAGLPSPTQFDTAAGTRQPPRSAPATKTQFRTLPSSRQNSVNYRPTGDLSSPDLDTPTDPRKSRFLTSVNGKARVFPSTPSPPVKARPKLAQLTEAVSQPAPKAISLTYRSPIHRPSTNPSFALGSGLVSMSHEWIHLNAQAFKVTIWGKIPADVQRAGWDDQSVPPYPDEPGYRWRVIQDWDVRLEDLTPLPDNVNSSELPSNTFLLTLGPHDRTYCIPGQIQLSGSRPSSPSTGYASDPESELHKVKRSEGLRPSSNLQVRRRRRGANLGDSKDIAKTATWPDLFQLATLQALIYDNDASLRTISMKVDRLVAEDEISPLKRQISERQTRISELNACHRDVSETCSSRRASILQRSQMLKQRRENLSLARESIGDAEEAEEFIRDRVEEERSQLAALHIDMTSTRSNLIAILSEIFPIELYSPVDLLFTIVDVAIPLPVNVKDPAPPLTVPEHKDINEDSVATGLGYVAQVLQILAAYLGTNLLYPVTCIGSRSLIRDNISAMIGPRMFPLYSKGVDTYRFEYGVFLLNKNIEILMGEKDLRALDMRHTLPNLKNLLLILSHESSRAEIPKSKFPAPSPSSLSLLSLDSDTMQEQRGNSNTPKAHEAEAEVRSGGQQVHTPPQSGSTTPIPTPVSDESRKSRFLALAPFTGFLRNRYPSTSRVSAKSVPEAGGGDEDGGDEEEDRSTIRGLVRDADAEEAAGHEAKVGVESAPTNPELKPQHGGHDIPLPESLAS